MRIGIVGFPFSGKKTFLRVLAKLSGISHFEDKVMAKIPDENLEFLKKLYSPKKVTPISMEFEILGNLSPEQSEKERTAVLVSLQEVDALLIVLRAFESDMVPPLPGYNSPLKQLEYVEEEMLLRDLAILESKIERLKNAKRKLSNLEERQLKVLEGIKGRLEEAGRPVSIELSEEEEKLISGYSLSSFKSRMVLVNLGEKEMREGYEGRKKIRKLCDEAKVSIAELPFEIILEVLELDEDERQEFLKEYGVEKIDLQGFTRAIMDSLGLITFYTAGEKEVRAWELKKGSTAVDAAAAIHSDLARGFIRAEVFSIEDLKREGSEKALKEKGLIQVVGKDHPIKDGDIIYIRFNV